MITNDSRYANSQVIVVTDDRGPHQSVVLDEPDDKVFAFTYHQIVDGQTIDYLAYRFLDDGRLWWLIADANPEIMDWSRLEPGTIIRIPYA